MIPCRERFGLWKVRVLILETILIKEIFISYSKNVEIGSKDKDSK